MKWCTLCWFNVSGVSLQFPGSEWLSSAADRGGGNFRLKDDGAPPSCSLVSTRRSRSFTHPLGRTSAPPPPAAHRLDHRPSGNQDQRDQAGVRSPDQDREPAGRDERPPRHHHGNAGQHQPGPVPHYLLVRRADSHPMNHCRRRTFKRVKGQAILISRNELFPSAVSNWSPEHWGESWLCTQTQQRFPVGVWDLYSDLVWSGVFLGVFLVGGAVDAK